MKPIFAKSAALVAALIIGAGCSSSKSQMPPADQSERPMEQPTEEMPVDVTVIQKQLNMHGAKLRVDGVMGAKTKKAISAFQKKNNLPVTGELNPATLAKLNS